MIYFFFGGGVIKVYVLIVEHNVVVHRRLYALNLTFVVSMHNVFI